MFRKTLLGIVTITILFDVVLHHLAFFNGANSLYNFCKEKGISLQDIINYSFGFLGVTFGIIGIGLTRRYYKKSLPIDTFKSLKRFEEKAIEIIKNAEKNIQLLVATPLIGTLKDGVQIDDLHWKNNFYNPFLESITKKPLILKLLEKIFYIFCIEKLYTYRTCIKILFLGKAIDYAVTLKNNLAKKTEKRNLDIEFVYFSNETLKEELLRHKYGDDLISINTHIEIIEKFKEEIGLKSNFDRYQVEQFPFLMCIVDSHYEEGKKPKAIIGLVDFDELFGRLKDKSTTYSNEGRDMYCLEIRDPKIVTFFSRVFNVIKKTNDSSQSIRQAISNYGKKVSYCLITSDKKQDPTLPNLDELLIRKKPS